MRRLGNNDSVVFRYRKTKGTDVSVVIRTHDLGGTTYDLIDYLPLSEAQEKYPMGSFLYPDEEVCYDKDHKPVYLGKFSTQARRLYHHHIHGGTLSKKDVEFFVRAIEHLEAELDK